MKMNLDVVEKSLLGSLVAKSELAKDAATKAAIYSVAAYLSKEPAAVSAVADIPYLGKVTVFKDGHVESYYM